MIAVPCSETRKPSWLPGPDSFHMLLIYKPIGQHHVSLVTLPHSLDSALTPPFPTNRPSEKYFLFHFFSNWSFLPMLCGILPSSLPSPPQFFPDLTCPPSNEP